MREKRNREEQISPCDGNFRCDREKDKEKGREKEVEEDEEIFLLHHLTRAHMCVPREE